MEKTETTGRTSKSEPEIKVNSNQGKGDCEDSQKEIDRFNTGLLDTSDATDDESRLHSSENRHITL